MIQKSKRIEERIEEKGNEGKEQAKAKKSKVSNTKTMEAKTEKLQVIKISRQQIDTKCSFLFLFHFSLFNRNTGDTEDTQKQQQQKN